MKTPSKRRVISPILSSKTLEPGSLRPNPGHSSSRTTRAKLRVHRWEHLNDTLIEVKNSSRDLGSHLCTTANLTASTLTNRMHEAITTCLKAMRTAFTPQKLTQRTRERRAGGRVGCSEPTSDPTSTRAGSLWPSGGTCGRLWASFGSLWGALGLPLAPFGVPWAPFGSLWGALCLAPFGRPLGSLWSPLGRLGLPWGVFWARPSPGRTG